VPQVAVLRDLRSLPIAEAQVCEYADLWHPIRGSFTSDNDRTSTVTSAECPSPSTARIRCGPAVGDHHIRRSCPTASSSTNHQIPPSPVDASSNTCCRSAATSALRRISCPRCGETIISDELLFAATALPSIPVTFAVSTTSGQSAPPESKLAINRSANGAAASAPTSAAEASPFGLPTHTTTVFRRVTAAHHASRCPLLVPVFHATRSAADSAEIADVRSGELMAKSACQHGSARITRRSPLDSPRTSDAILHTPPRASVAYASAISSGVASAPPIASVNPYPRFERPIVLSPNESITPIARSTPTCPSSTSAGILRLSASASPAGIGPRNARS
jgi:hypothetical protein